jgi:hypothetical protein
LLKGKHLVLVGNSITRYQYLSLVTLLWYIYNSSACLYLRKWLEIVACFL